MKLGTIGTSWITERFISAAKETGWELGVIYSREISKALTFTEKHGGTACADLKQMLSSDVDTVYIASPNSLHFEQLCLCLEAGKHVICEKPIVTNEKDFQSAYGLADKKGLFLIEAYRHINSTAFAALESHLQDIAPVRSVSFLYNQYSSRYEAYKRGENPNVFNPAFAGGALMDLGVYPISLACALFDRPKAISYLPQRLANGIDGGGVVLLDYSDFVCTISFSKISEGLASSEILGEAGGILIDKPSELNCLTLVKNKQSTDISVTKHENTLYEEAKVFYKLIQTKDTTLYHRLRHISGLTNEVVSFCRRA